MRYSWSWTAENEGKEIHRFKKIYIKPEGYDERERGEEREREGEEGIKGFNWARECGLFLAKRVPTETSGLQSDLISCDRKVGSAADCRKLICERQLRISATILSSSRR